MLLFMIFDATWTNVIVGILSLTLLILSAEIIMRKSIKLTQYFGLSQTFIGLTIFSISTSIPEIAANIIAGIEILKGKLDPIVLSSTAMGTTIGSDNIQITLVVGLVALFATLKASRQFLKTHYLMMIAVDLIAIIFSLNFFLGRGEGLVLIAVYIGYLFYLARKEKQKQLKNHVTVYKSRRGVVIDSIIVLVGIGIILTAAEFVFRSAAFFVKTFQISGSLIGVAIIGVATALPELTTSLIAAFKKASNISLGILIGSNITNMSFALGLGAVIAGYHVSAPILYYDMLSRLILPIIALFFFWRGKITRLEAILLIVLYLLYIGLRLIFVPTGA
jgi:cation:H+ antiporter